MRMLKKKKGHVVTEREKGRSWDIEGNQKPIVKRRPYKSMSFTASELQQQGNNEIDSQIKVINTTAKKTHVSNLLSPKTQRRGAKHLKREKGVSEKTQIYRKKIVVADASTQTAIDAATQTSDDEKEEKFTKLVEVKNVPSSNAFTSTDPSEIGEMLKAISFGVQTFEEKKGDICISKNPTENILGDLNDLENEIAKIRYKALSLQESIKWLEREKISSLRPTRPVGDEVQTDSDGELDEIPTRDTNPQFGFLPVGATPPPTKRRGGHTKIKGNRTLSVPVVLSTPVHFESPPRVTTGPDQSKFRQIPESSVFNRISPNQLTHIRKHSKSLNDLPELRISYTQDHRAIVEDPQIPRRTDQSKR